MRIEHPEEGIVEGVEEAFLSMRSFGFDGWSKDGFFYYRSKGWREVPESVNVTYEMEPRGNALHWQFANTAYLPESVNLEWRKVQAVVLPQGMTWRQFWAGQLGHKTAPSSVCEQHETTCLQVWKGER